jgi:hypothetical protein
MDMDMVRLKKNAMKLAWLARMGQRQFSARIVMALLVHPLDEVVRHMEQTKAQRFLTLKEAMRKSGRGKNFFEKPLASEGGRSRLELWKQEGLADRTDEGLWLISPFAVAEARRTSGGDAEPPEDDPQTTDLINGLLD